jgi:isopentenyl-diphosphate delta-isomerase
MASVDQDLVVLLDDAGHPSGTASRLTVHGHHTPLHLAFSCYLVNPQGQVL